MKTSGKIRAALVGAGAALSAALLLSIAEALGLSEQEMTDDWGIVGTFFLALVAVAVDRYTAWLEKKAENDD